ncbi:MAG: carboxylesterase family protein [Erysipelotrichaceae bacterium]|nr:carboxylesterase family protein [Erysipelotrichaceae bacterium]
MLNIVETKYGKVKSVSSNAGYALFRGVPFAKPPVGQLRFKAPEEPEKWEGIRVCDTYGPACAQYDRWGSATDDINDDSEHPYIMIDNYPYPPKMSEDCLYLNIYTPSESGNEKLPVMMYIHGGGCQQWYGNDYEYCGDHFCEKGCILVSINYRLNVFGFLAHPELDKESPYHNSGNYGLLDQIAALKWIYENIEAFGGDKDNITVFGQSSGGRSTLSLLCSPLTRGMIRRVSIQSAGGLGRFMSDRSIDETKKLGVSFMESLGCHSVEEMRALDWKVLRDKNDELGFEKGFNITEDGYVLDKDIDECFLNDLLPENVDIIIGCTADEGANEKEPIFGINMVKQIERLCDVFSKNHPGKIHAYIFDQIQPGDDAGVPHSCDNRYQFGTLNGCWRPYTEEDYRLSDQMTSYWANFAKSGDPNGEGLAKWDPYDENKEFMWLKGSGSLMKKISVV